MESDLAPGIRRAFRRGVDPGFEPGDELASRLLSQGRPVAGRHHPGPELADDLFPDFGVRRDGREVEAFEAQARGHVDGVVAVQAMRRHGLGVLERRIPAATGHQRHGAGD